MDCALFYISLLCYINQWISLPHLLGREGPQIRMPPSPLLFLLVMEDLSRRITAEKVAKNLRGLKIIDQCSLSHLLFVDDILIFLDGGIKDIINFTDSLRLFSPA